MGKENNDGTGGNFGGDISGAFEGVTEPNSKKDRFDQSDSTDPTIEMNFGSASQTESHSIVAAPRKILFMATGAAALALVLLLPSPKLFNVIGYLVATLGVTSLVTWFRTKDRRLQLERNYVFNFPSRSVSLGLLVVGTALGAFHAVQFFTVTSLAS